MSLKVLVVGMSDTIGGVERVVLSVVSRNGNTQFDFLCYGEDYIYEKDLPGSKFYYLPKRRNHFFRSQNKLKEFFKTHGNDYDCIWVNTSSASNISVHRMAKRYSDATVITHSHSSRIEHDNPFLKIAHKILHLINRRNLVKKTDVLVACSKMAAMHLYGKACQRAIIIYNGISTEKFMFDEKVRTTQRESLGITPDAVVTLVCGRLVEAKNVEYALRVFKAYREKTGNSNSWIIIVGDGPERDNLKRLIDMNNIENVIFTGFQNDVKPYLDASDIVLQPSLFEGFPVSTVEAQTNGLRCILSDRITKEVDLTDLVTFHGITESDIPFWVDDMVRNTATANRVDYRRVIEECGLDIGRVASKMEEIFKSRGT